MANYLDSMLNGVLNDAAAYADAYNNGSNRKTLKALKSKATEAVKEYNLALSRSYYRQLAKQGEPVKAAIRSLYVPGTKRLQFKTDDEDRMVAILRDDKTYEVSLPMMQATIGAGAFNDAKWFNKAEKLASLMANVLNDRTIQSSLFKYDIAQASHDFNFGDGVDPYSNEGVITALQEVFDAILFIPDEDHAERNLIHTHMKVDKAGQYNSVEWEYIKHSMIGNGGVGQLVVQNTGKFTGYILHCMHLNMTNGDYGIEVEGKYVMPTKDDFNDPVEAPAETAEA